MKSRLIAAVALSAAIIVGTTGCGFTDTMGTSLVDEVSDGINVADSGPIIVRNAMIIVGDDPTVGNFVAAAINMTDTAETLTMQVGEGSDVVTETIRVDANTVVSLGTAGEKPVRLEGVDALAGSTLPVFFQSGDAEGVDTDVPVLNGDQQYLATLVPTPAPSSTRG